ncbi:antibiotic biosynthesis monooxygenase family protein [Kitasatospora sp. NPDC051914]|uniref:antibiotic biosynthesis monooxygenase family protein n=1 Tax=Kitasatospora sp. NPDC051914 TaxID=3154945 RepID=UPI003427B4BB
MLQENEHWSSAYWEVSEGRAEEFVERWQEFLTWTKAEAEGFFGARLIRSLGDPYHFVSFAAWRDVDAMRSWQSRPEFAERFGACHALCKNVRSGGFELAVSI